MANSRLKPLGVTVCVGYAISAAAGIPLLLAESTTHFAGRLLLFGLGVIALSGFFVGTWAVVAYEVHSTSVRKHIRGGCCLECGHQLTDGQQYCPECGHHK